MAIFDLLKGGKKGKDAIATNGDHSMSQPGVFLHTGQVTPIDVDFRTVEKAAVLPRIPTYLTREQADALEQHEMQKKLMLEETKRGYKALNKVIGYDTEVHQTHREAQIDSANNELKRQTANNRLAGHLHNQRSEYHDLGASYQKAERSATSQIAAKRAAYGR